MVKKYKVSLTLILVFCTVTAFIGLIYLLTPAADVL